MHKINISILTHFLFVDADTKEKQTGKTVTYEIRQPDGTVSDSGNMEEITGTAVYYKTWTPDEVGWWIFIISCSNPTANDMCAYLIEAGLEKDTTDMLESGTYGLSALKNYVDEVETLLKSGTYGLSALKTALSTHDSEIKALINALDDASASDVWSYVTRSLTDKAGFTIAGTKTRLDDLNDLAQSDILSDATPFAGGDVGTIKTKVQTQQVEMGFPSESALNSISSTGEQTTTERTITVSLPNGASIVRVALLAFITALNDTENAQKIDITVQGRKGAGSWNNFFSQDDVIGFGDTDGATSSFVAVQDVTSLIDAATSYGFRLSVNQSSANAVRYTTQYVVLVTYKMS